MTDHNFSAQRNVAINNDPALDISHEHRHAHLHHDAFAEKGRHDDPMYTTGTTFEHSMIPDQSPMDHNLHRRHHLAEKGTVEVIDTERAATQSPPLTAEDDPRSHSFSNFYARYRIFFHLALWLLFTGWWVASLVLHRNDKNWIIPFLLWGAIALRLFFFHVPITVITKPMHWIWRNTAVRVTNLIPEKLRMPIGAAITIAVLLIGAFASPESEDNTRENRAVSLFGLVVFLFVLWATSKHRNLIKWHTGMSSRASVPAGLITDTTWEQSSWGCSPNSSSHSLSCARAPATPSSASSHS